MRPIITYDTRPAPDLMGPEGLNIADAYARVNDALLADSTVVYKSCKRCYGTGKVPVYWWDDDRDCPDCGGTGTRATA